MGVTVKGQMGPRTAADGTDTEIRLTRDSSVATQDAHGRYQEPVFRGSVYSLATSAAGVTVAAANVAGAANSQPIVGIWNPPNSGKAAVILHAAAVWNSGTPGAGGLVWAYAYSTGTSPVAGTNAGINNYTLQTGGHVCKTGQGATAFTSMTMAILRILGGPTVGALAANSASFYNEDTGGAIIVPPGAAVGLMAASAGTSPIITASMMWEEITL